MQQGVHQHRRTGEGGADAGERVRRPRAPLSQQAPEAEGSHSQGRQRFERRQLQPGGAEQATDHGTTQGPEQQPGAGDRRSRTHGDQQQQVIDPQKRMQQALGGRRRGTAMGQNRGLKQRCRQCSGCCGGDQRGGKT